MIRRSRSRSRSLVAAWLLLVPLLATLPAVAGRAQDASPAAPPAIVPDGSVTGTVDLGMVDDPAMAALAGQLAAFNRLYPNVTVNATLLPPDESRRVIAEDLAAGAGRFDVVVADAFDVPLWARAGWLAEVGADAAADPDYGLDDVFPAHRDGLSYGAGLYGLPFSGEGSMIFYRTDLFRAARITMPRRPTWDEIGEFAAELDGDEVAGICLRGRPGWDEQIAPLTAMINAFGGRWYDEGWEAQLDGDESAAAIAFYLTALREHGPPAPEANGFAECETLFNEGRVAMWYDATSAADLVADPERNPNADRVGFAPPPTQVSPDNAGNWLGTRGFALAATSDQRPAALAFMKWATSPTYLQTVVEAEGFARVPTGARASLYRDPAYRRHAAGYAGIVRDAIVGAAPNRPTLLPVPYAGGQFVRIPEFPLLGNDASQEFAAALVGLQGIDDAIAAADELANRVAIDAGYRRAGDDRPSAGT